MSNTFSVAVLATAAALASAAAAPPADLAMNAPTNVSGVEVVCTGIGSAQQDPRWAAHPLRIMLAGKGGHWLSDATITISRDNTAVVTTHCGGPWLLAKLAAGNYEISGTLDEGPSAATKAKVAATGQARVVLRFPDRGGSVSR